MVPSVPPGVSHPASFPIARKCTQCAMKDMYLFCPCRKHELLGKIMVAEYLPLWCNIGRGLISQAERGAAAKPADLLSWLVVICGYFFPFQQQIYYKKTYIAELRGLSLGISVAF